MFFVYQIGTESYHKTLLLVSKTLNFSWPKKKKNFNGLERMNRMNMGPQFYSEFLLPGSYFSERKRVLTEFRKDEIFGCFNFLT